MCIRLSLLALVLAGGLASAAELPKIAGLAVAKPGVSLAADPEWAGRFRTLKSSADGSEQPFYWYDPGVAEAVPLVVVLHTWSASCDWNSPANSVIGYCRKNKWAMVYPNFRGPNRRPEACGSDLAVQDVLDTRA